MKSDLNNMNYTGIYASIKKCLKLFNIIFMIAIGFTFNPIMCASPIFTGALVAGLGYVYADYRSYMYENNACWQIKDRIKNAKLYPTKDKKYLVSNSSNSFILVSSDDGLKISKDIAEESARRVIFLSNERRLRTLSSLLDESTFSSTPDQKIADILTETMTYDMVFGCSEYRLTGEAIKLSSKYRKPKALEACLKRYGTSQEKLRALEIAVDKKYTDIVLLLLKTLGIQRIDNECWASGYEKLLKKSKHYQDKTIYHALKNFRTQAKDEMRRRDKITVPIRECYSYRRW